MMLWSREGKEMVSGGGRRWGKGDPYQTWMSLSQVGREKRERGGCGGAQKGPSLSFYPTFFSGLTAWGEGVEDDVWGGVVVVMCSVAV